MEKSLNPKIAAEQAQDTFHKTAAQFEVLARDTEVPQAMRDLAEKNVTQMRETYERAKDALEAVLESWERTFDAANQGAVALNRKFIDIAQRNINSSFDLAKSLAGAKNLSEAMELQGTYWRKQLAALFTPEAAPDWFSGALTMTAVVKGATTSAIPTDEMTIGATTPIQ